MSKKISINIANDFSDTPGPRLIIEGRYSAEEFFKSLLLPKFKQAEKEGKKLIVDMNGVYGYPPSFLDESFGRLVQESKMSVKKILEIMTLECTREHYIRYSIDRMNIWYSKNNKNV